MDERQYLIERGKRAEALMKDEFFDLVIRDVEADIVSGMLATAPHETKKREGLYAEHQGLKNIVGALQNYVHLGLTQEEGQSAPENV